jgi:gliding motility-associated lipoprotein GldH
MKLKLIFLFLFTILQSCNKNQVFNEFHNDFEDNRWASNDVKVFEFENVASDGLHVIKLQLSHIYDFDFAEIPIEVELIAPSETKEVLLIDLKLKDASGNDVGDCTGDICDVYCPIKSNVKLQKGIYTIKVKSNFPGAYLPNILGVGVVVEKLEK